MSDDYSRNTFHFLTNLACKKSILLRTVWFHLVFKHENLLLVLLNVCLSSLRLILWFSSYPVIFLFSCNFPLILWLSSYSVTFPAYFYLSLLISTYIYLFLLITWILVLISWIPASKNLNNEMFWNGSNLWFHEFSIEQKKFSWEFCKNLYF